MRSGREADWLRPLEYGLIGLVAVLAGATAALWLRQRRARVGGSQREQELEEPRSARADVVSIMESLIEALFLLARSDACLQFKYADARMAA